LVSQDIGTAADLHQVRGCSIWAFNNQLFEPSRGVGCHSRWGIGDDRAPVRSA